jgi:c-di-GMP-binding flagellar brake protein YcgR
MTEDDADRPEASSHADVTLVTRGITVTAKVEVSADSGLVVRPISGWTPGEAPVQAGDRVEVYWVSGYEERTLPAKVSAVDEDPIWRLAPTGPAERSQRRKAVRGRVALPISLPWAGALLSGTTIDLSEGGVKALVAGWGLPPDPGTRSEVSISLEDGVLDVIGEVAWHQARGAQWLIALKFHDVPEKVADRLRRRVFQALREERASLAG